MASRITDASRLRLHRLHFRRDNDEWIVGRLRGEFVALSTVAVFVVRQLHRGRSVGQVRQLVLRKFGHALDVRLFAVELVKLGFVARVDGRRLRDRHRQNVTFPWMRHRHVGWLVKGPTLFVIAVVVMIAAEIFVAEPAVRPHSSDFFWTQSATVNLLSTFGLGWVCLFLHEMAHLATARAFGIPGNITLGTRLQFLVAQTNVTGVWVLQQYQRLSVYVAGMVMDVFLASVAVIVRLFTSESEWLHEFLGVVTLVAIGSLPFQLLVFMRTDVYFVLQDLLGCKNLAHDGWAYVRWRVSRVRLFVLRKAVVGMDPSSDLSRRECWAVRVYSFLLFAGSVVCVLYGLFVTGPAFLHLMRESLFHAFDDVHLSQRIDAFTSLLLIFFVFLLWGTVFWTRHVTRQLPLLQRILSPTQR